jgi:hypothetical protein
MLSISIKDLENRFEPKSKYEFDNKNYNYILSLELHLHKLKQLPKKIRREKLIKREKDDEDFPNRIIYFVTK